MNGPFERAYVFDDAFGELHLVGHGAPAPDRGTPENTFRLRHIFFDESNAMVRERLLADLDLSCALHRRTDEAGRGHFAEAVFRAIERTLTVYRVPRRRLVAVPEKPLVLVPVSTGSPPVERPWIGLELIDQNGKPVPNRPFRIVTADNQTIDGTLDDEGGVRIDGLAPGTCQVDCPYVAPRAATTHVVEPGDHASRIAMLYGFEDFNTVWSHGENSDLRGARENPHQLVEGDEVYVPEIPPRSVYRPTNEMYTFRVRISPLKLRVKIVDDSDEPLAGVACTVDDLPLTSDGDGVVEIPIDKLTGSSTLTLNGVSVALQIGHLNPAEQETEAGWKARLFNMGFVVDPMADDDEVALALEDFQAQYDLETSGVFDDATTAKLKEIYGC